MPWADDLSSCVTDVITSRSADPLRHLAHLLSQPSARPDWEETASAYAVRHNLEQRLGAALDAAGLTAFQEAPPDAIDRLCRELLASAQPEVAGISTATTCLSMGEGPTDSGNAKAAFHAVDADKGGKITLQELGAMLQAQGFAWSPKRIEGFLCAFDENGDGALDLTEIVNGLEQLTAVAGAVLEKQQPSEPAVAAGVVAVGSRLDKNNYVEEMAAWARDPQQLLPKAVLLQANMAAVRAIGPAYHQQLLEQQHIDELTKAVEAVKEADVAFRTRAEHQLAEAKKRKAKADAKLKDALDRIKAIMLESAEAISPGLARDGEKYTEAINQLVANEPDVLEEVNAEAAAMVSSGALKVGDEVEVVEGGAMQRAQVRRVVDQAEGTYELSLWREVHRLKQKYEAGFDTSNLKLVRLPRRSIYANTKQKQVLRPWP